MKEFFKNIKLGIGIGLGLAIAGYIQELILKMSILFTMAGMFE